MTSAGTLVSEPMMLINAKEARWVALWGDVFMEQRGVADHLPPMPRELYGKVKQMAALHSSSSFASLPLDIDSERELLTAKDAAAMLVLDVSTIYKLRDKLKRQKIAGRYYYVRADIEEEIKGRQLAEEAKSRGESE